MSTVASRLLRAARNASRAAAMASRSARAAAAAASRAARLGSGVAPVKSCATRGCASTKPRYDNVPDDAKSPTDKDLESDDTIWALYERWCKAFNKERDHAEMFSRFKIFRYHAKGVHHWNTHLPPDPEEAAIYIQKRREAKLLLSKGEDVSNFEEWHLPMDLGPYADGGDPFISEHSKRLMKAIEEKDPSNAVICLGKSRTLDEMK